MNSKRFLKHFLLRNDFIKFRKIRYSTAQLDISLKTARNPVDEEGEDVAWENALPYKKIPGPSKLSFVTAFLPGGKYYKKTLIDIYTLGRQEYGNILILPGIFGKRDVVITFDPADFEKVFRTEGKWPIRRGLDSVEYYRKVERADIYKHASGLVAEQGAEWGRFRSTVNPIMMQPKTVKLYIPPVDDVINEFVERIRTIRDASTLEVPSNFDEEIQHWALESIGLVALDTRLGLINEFSKNPDARKIIATVTTFFKLMYELDIKPSMWKIFPTSKFKEMINIQDTMVEICTKYIDQTMERIRNGSSKSDYENSVLEKLLKIDKQVAIVMAMDMVMAGIDTTSSAFTACLFQLGKNHDKQSRLRDELKKTLPEKQSALTKENMKNLPYLRACIKEALRLYPISVGNFRTTGQDLVLSGYQIPKGADISMGSLVLQRDDAHFPNALKFLPERWLRNNPEKTECPSAKTANPFIYLPFGFGPRMCIGKRFVELELEVAISRIIRNFRVEYNHPDFVFHTNIVNYPTGDFRFKFVDLDA